MTDFQGKRVLVTGAGRGLGAAIAEGFAQAGAETLLADIEPATLAATAEALSARGLTARAIPLDVTDRAAVEALAATLDGLDVLVSNAGVAGRATFDDPAQAEVWDRVIAVNLGGAFNVARALTPALIARRGNVVQLSSVAGFVAGGSTAGYVTSKGAIRSLTQAMARDLAPHGVRVNAVAPGIMDSEMANAQLARPGGADWFLTRAMLGRIGTQAELVAPILFLASDRASFITGTVLPVDGGFLAA